MTPAEFIDLVQQNASRVHAYQLGHDGSDGTCDCIGLIIGAWRMGGNSWPWTHGSNYTARHLTRNLAKDAPLQLGDLVFKGRNPNDAGYALPSRYQNGSDLTDYYHVGVLTSLNPLEITHCTGVPGGIKVDTKRGQWRYSGQFSKLENSAMTEKEMMVTAPSGGTVNLRQGPKKTYHIIEKVKVGDIVTVITDTEGWAFVRHGDKQGYMEDKFLTEAPEKEPEPAGGVLYERVIKVRQMLEEALAEIQGIENTLN